MGFSKETLAQFIVENIVHQASTKVRKPGRPIENAPHWDIDAKRAWIVWYYVRAQREAGHDAVNTMTVAQLIDGARGLPKGEEILPKVTETRLASSVSSGKRKLNISEDWVSPTCEKYLPINRNR